MFQIEPILWLRMFASPGMDLLMATVSRLGYSEVYGAVMVCLIFGYHMKKGLAVMVAAFLVGLMTFSLKTGLAFPRPADIDHRVFPPGYEPPLKLIKSGVGQGFWDLPSQEALQVASIQQNWSYGLPSGHVSAATAFLLGIALFFRSRKVLWFSMAWIPLMCMSRMYLGRHFLADVLGGIMVGLLGVLMAYLLLKKLNRADQPDIKSLRPLALIIFPISIFAPFVDLIHTENAGRILSMLLVYVFMINRGFPRDSGHFWQRASRVLIVSLSYFLIDQLLDVFLDLTGWEDLPLMAMLGTCLSNVVAFVGGVAISRRSGLY